MAHQQQHCVYMWVGGCICMYVCMCVSVPFVPSRDVFSIGFDAANELRCGHTLSARQNLSDT